MDRCLLHFVEPETEPPDVFSSVNAAPRSRLRPTLIIGPDSYYRRQLRQRTKDRTNKLVAPAGSDITALLMSPDPQKCLAGVMADQLSLTLLSPYQLGGGVNREALFFGRREIIAHIMNRDPANYLVVSGRQLGKSSLLKALERRFADHPGITCLYRSLSNEVLVPRLAGDLGLPRQTDLEGIASHIAKSENRFMILIDEADKFIREERKTDYQILDAMRRMSEEGHCHFILAGFWELYRHAVLDYQSPLKNFAETIRIGELEADACRRLATVPMENLRLRYADTGLIERLIGETGQRANLMVIACQEILSGLKPNQRVIEKADVKRALCSSALFDTLKGWAAMTDDSSACAMDRVIVYATIEMEGFNLKELVEILEDHGHKANMQQLDNSLDRLVLGFVLGKKESGNYFYRVPLFRKMIMRDDHRTRLKKELEVLRI
jgi:hypothetical protein